MQLQINESINEFHFQGTFQFPDDMDFLTRSTEHQCFVDLFNQMIENRLKNQYTAMNPNFKVTTNYAKPIGEISEKIFNEVAKNFKVSKPKPIGNLCDNIFEQASKIDKP